MGRMGRPGTEDVRRGVRENGKSRGTAVPTVQLPCIAYRALPCLIFITILNTMYIVSSVFYG
jgi:hypothetical protein